MNVDLFLEYKYFLVSGTWFKNYINLQNCVIYVRNFCNYKRLTEENGFV